MRHLSGWKLALACLVVLALTTRTHIASWNDAARMATIESLVHRHTFIIDQSPFVGTGDKIVVRGHFYSNKPPVLDVAGAAVLSALEPLLGLRLHAGPSVAYYLLTLILIGVPSAVALAALDRAFRRRDFADADRVLAVAGFALATLVWPYSTVFNNHTPAGALLLLAAVALFPARGSADPRAIESGSIWKSKIEPGSMLQRRAMWAGMAAALALAIDPPPAGLFIVAFLAYLVVRAIRWNEHGSSVVPSSWTAPAWFVAGLVPPLVLQVGLQLLATGAVLPANLHREYWIYPGSGWGGVPISGQFHLTSFSDGVSYAFHSLAGSRGFLSYSPFLLWGLAALVAASWTAPRDERNYARAVLAASVATMAYLVLFATQYGGVSYGERYFVGLSGVIVLFTPRGFWSRAPRWRRGLLAAALAVSVVISGLGVVANPWRVETPAAAVDLVQRGGIRSTVRHLGVLDLWGPNRWKP
jgi:hypothetical protein